MAGANLGGVGFKRTPLFADLLVFIVTSSVLDTQRLSANPVWLQHNQDVLFRSLWMLCLESRVS